MVKAIFFFVVSIMFFIISKKSKSFFTVDMTGTETTGVIKKVVYVSGGNVLYDVSFQDMSGTIVGGSIPYSSETKSLNEGEVVKIKYRFTKAIRPTVVILDERIKPCADSLVPLTRVLSIVGIICFIISIIFFLKNIRI